MERNGKTKTLLEKGSLPKPSATPHKKTNHKEIAISFLKKIKTIHIVAVIGVFSVFIGYLSVAPPTDLPNWPLYSLNARTWQFFERWGQHVKPYHVRLMTTALQHLESRALYILTFLEVPDFIEKANKPLSCEEIKTMVDEGLGYEPLSLSYLCRVLHASAHFDFLEETSDDRYTLTPLSKYLTSSHPKSLKGFVKFYSGDEALVISTALSRSMFSGKSGFKEVYRTELQEHLTKDPMFQDIYDAGTADLSRFHAPAIIADYPPFGSCKHICDIGGGLGTFLHAILEYYGFNINGTNFDLPDVIENSRAYFKGMNIEDKVNLVSGNFSKKLPQFNCDCYLLKDILENFSDEDASVILATLLSVMKKGNRLLVIERVMHTGTFSDEKFKALMDLTMMAFNPSHSRLRTSEELYFLLEGSGFVEPQTYPTRAGYNIIEAYPDSQ